MTARLALGTVQFGMRYGVANAGGQPPQEEVDRILHTARDGGLDLLDTAVAYGESEAVLGRIGVAGWKIVTKVPAVPDDVDDIDGWMKTMVAGSLARLGIERLHGLLLHSAAQMRGPRAAEIADALCGLLDLGTVGRIGVSIYDPQEDLPPVLEHFVPGIVQAPFNILDIRLIASGWAERLRRDGTEIHTRSAFLQGLLLMPAWQRPSRFARWSGIWEEWQRWLKASELSPTEACLRFALSQPLVDRCVVGVDSARQLCELMEVVAEPLTSLPRWPEPPEPDLVNPSRWS